ncbi:uncharacterized protein LOC114852183 isoform X3 [Betta splendens]|uniref:Uncharacterized protein LOC114852183 isoform X3 n=1 Tax=Betta splendens TaxID=158456 RepID=A0A6P7M114_BETSP|nr:uncharacterized protein LOC114852183 isoform X3 [Betta splendens]
MSTSDSDCSLDWLASDEDDCDGPQNPELVVEPPAPSSTRSSFCSGTHKRRRSDCKDEDAFRPIQGFTSVCLLARDRAHGTGRAEPDTEHKQFTHKLAELQCYLQPLSTILCGLRSGRYSERLSRFQESVAMDRIQRIMGVIQNPDMGGRFFSIILKMEEMLHSWFPHIKATLAQTDDSTAAKKQKQNQSSASSPHVEPAASYSSTQLRRLHSSLACSLKAPESRPSPPTRCSQGVTQDNAVSSSTDSLAGPRRRLSRGPLPFKVSSPCLERLLQAKESIIAPRTVGEDGWLPWLPADDS